MTQIAKHKAAVEAHPGAKFFALACEAGGHMDPGQMLGMIKMLANEARIENYRPLQKNILTAFATGIQIGNARILQSAIARVERWGNGARASFLPGCNQEAPTAATFASSISGCA